MATLFPQPQTQLPPPPKPDNTTELVDKLAKALATTSASKEASIEEEKKEEKSSVEDSFETLATEKYKLCPEAFQKLLTMCGVTVGEEEQIPPFWRKIAQPKASTNDKLGMARAHLADNVLWKEAKAPPLHPVLNMFVTQKFEEKTTLNTLKSACVGLTPFAVPHLSDSEVEQINEQSTALEAATSTTVQDMLQNKVQAKAPASFEKLVSQIKMFGNLIFAFFGHRCPLLIELHDILDDLNEYSEYARKNTSRKTLATILWILHLQSRHFAAGKMEGSHSLIAPYRYMITSVRTTQPVFNGNVPEDLYAVKEKKEKPKPPQQETYRGNQNKRRED